MAKKKDFENIVDESFEEGYKSEPGTGEEVTVADVEQKEAPAAEVARPVLTDEELAKIWAKKADKRTPEEREAMLELLLANDERALNNVLTYAERSTYYITDVHRECIDIVSGRRRIKKNDVIVAALDAYFSDEDKKEAERRAVETAVIKLKHELGIPVE